MAEEARGDAEFLWNQPFEVGVEHSFFLLFRNRDDSSSCSRDGTRCGIGGHYAFSHAFEKCRPCQCALDRS
jgi:hypothetical protein